MTLSRVVMLITAIVVIFLAAMITHRPVSAQNGTLEGRVARNEFQLESQEQTLARIEGKLNKLEDQMNQASTAFTELKAVVYTAASLFVILLSGQLVVSLRKKP